MPAKAKKAVLVCNGSLDTKYLYSFIGKGDFLIAVDGGANKLVGTKFVPGIIIGDFDSISKKALKKFRSVQMLKFPREKDMVDLELALNYCVEKKFREIIILGALGSRADMALTNVFLLSQIPEKISAKILYENQEIFLVRKNFSMKGIPGEIVSFFPIQGNVKGLTLKGFKYGLKGFDLRFGIGMGLSNEFKSKKASISFKDGLLLCVHFRKWF
ncbi:MAG TPA: thiamine diphosphokinase [archaeon]|nr:thiamine diphosphokinase [archaeon]